jgi:hypothetical protein
MVSKKLLKFNSPDLGFLALSKIKICPEEKKDLLTILASDTKRHYYCEVFGRTTFKVSGSGTIASRIT